VAKAGERVRAEFIHERIYLLLTALRINHRLSQSEKIVKIKIIKKDIELKNVLPI